MRCSHRDAVASTLPGESGFPAGRTLATHHELFINLKCPCGWEQTYTIPESEICHGANDRWQRAVGMPLEEAERLAEVLK